MVNSASLQDTNKVKARLRLRICVSCRHKKCRSEMIRLTFDYKERTIVINSGSPRDRLVCGRSAYLCRNITCVDQALKGTRLKIALEGRKPKSSAPRRQVAWPLESQLIHTLRLKSTEISETCQNTPGKEGS